MNNSNLLFLIALGIFIGLVGCTPIEGTNAQRFARGLPPNPPKNLWNDLSNGMKAATPRLEARWGTPSSLPSAPSVTLNGRLQIRNPKDGSVLGNIRNWSGGGTISGVNFLGPDEDLLVSLSYNPSHPHKINILATNPTFPAPFYVGAGTFSTSTVPKLSHNSPNVVQFTNVELTPRDARPTIPPTRQVYVESAIWSFDKDTNELKAHWINADGSKPRTTIAYDIRENAIFFVGDLAAYNHDNDLPASAVKLFLVPE